ncbi:MAG: haloacid dehalogenase type II [Solirubrobacterales bacterium]|nr:haloacid dehalogenase type II [Solirubrobacterales bacterium]
MDYAAFEALTFDCYGTLIDWERGLLEAARPILAAHGASAGDDDLLEAYARHEAALEAGPYAPYREVVGSALIGVGADLGFAPSDDEAEAFATAVGAWPPFADSPEALRRLATRYRLGVITNCDDDLFARSARQLGVAFDEVVTAQQAEAYKPRPDGFALMLERLALPRERVLHVAQSLFHDHVPAKALGLATVWIDRRQGRSGSGATPPAEAAPDAVFPDLASFAAAAVPEA